MQDTHFNSKIEKYVKSEWGYTCVFASFKSNSRGVAILFSNNFEFKINKITRDKNGNYLLISLSTMEKDLLLVNVYGLNKNDPNFYDSLKETIKTFNTNNVIAMGDWNIALDPNMDCFNYTRNNNPKGREALENMTLELNSADIWRENNPQSRRCTWRRPTPLKQSRLDYFLLSDYLYWYFEDANILPGYRSYHSIITLTLKFTKCIKRKVLEI